MDQPPPNMDLLSKRAELCDDIMFMLSGAAVNSLDAQMKELRARCTNTFSKNNEKRIKELLNNHIKHDAPYSTGLILGALFLSPPIVIHFLNPCITYSPILMWSVGGMFIALSFFTILSVTIRDTYSRYCIPEYLRDHEINEVYLFCCIGTMMMFYEVYSFNFSWPAILWSVLIGFWSGMLYVPCLLHDHYHGCKLRGHKHIDIEQGSKGVFATMIYALDVIWYIFLIGTILVSFGMNNYFYDQPTPRPSEACIG